MSRIVIVVDTLGSGLGIAALARSQRDSNYVVVPALEFPTINSLVNQILQLKPNYVIFSWRFLLLEVLQSRKNVTKIQNFSPRPYIGVLIADYLGRNSDFRTQEISLLNSVDFYMVTCKDLEAIYGAEKYQSVFAGVLHDIPSIPSTAPELPESAPRTRITKVLWVGNSKWGARQQLIDHKGMYSIVLPLFKLLKFEFPDIELELIDSGSQRLPNSEVLKQLTPSTLLIQTSESEGTGLPLLEALARGSTPITTRVGVAPEILVGRFEELIVRKELLAFYEKCSEFIKSNPYLPFELQKLFNNHIETCSGDQISDTALKLRRCNLSYLSVGLRPLPGFWLVRYLRHRWGRLRFKSLNPRN
jgi:glycosyltransferase involved in cell wall biosynthesis